MGNCCRSASSSGTAPNEGSAPATGDRPSTTMTGKKTKLLPLVSAFEADKGLVSSMAIVGDVTPTSAKIFWKASSPGEWILMVSTKPFEFGQYPQSKEGCKLFTRTFSVANGLTGCFECQGLQENTIYYYSVCGTGTTVANPSAFFCTAKSSYGSVTVAFYSCHDPFHEDGHYEKGAWNGLADLAHTLDLVISGGDQIYLDNSSGMTDLWVFLREHQGLIETTYVDATTGTFDAQAFSDYIIDIIRKYYAIYWNDPTILRLFGRVPQYMIWDDHEIMDGWGSLTPEEKLEVFQYDSCLFKKYVLGKLEKGLGIATIKRKGYEIKDLKLVQQIIQTAWHACAQVYYEYQHCHNPTPVRYNPQTDKPEGFQWDYTFCRGTQYQFFVLDMRGNHDCTAPSDRLLGDAQHQRIQTWLDAMPSDTQVAFFVSPVPVVHWDSIVDLSVYFMKTLKDDLMDAWSHSTNHTERTRLLDSLLATSHERKIPIVVFGGDVHCMAAYTLTDTERYPDAKIINITASAISRKPVTAAATIAFAGNGNIKYKTNDGNGKTKSTSIYCQQMFAKAGVNNFAVMNAEGSTVSCTFYWVAKSDRDELKSSVVTF